MSSPSAFTPGRSMWTHTSVPRRKASMGMTPLALARPEPNRLNSVSKSRKGSVWINMSGAPFLAVPPRSAHWSVTVSNTVTVTLATIFLPGANSCQTRIVHSADPLFGLLHPCREPVELRRGGLLGEGREQLRFLVLDVRGHELLQLLDGNRQRWALERANE